MLPFEANRAKGRPAALVHWKMSTHTTYSPYLHSGSVRETMLFQVVLHCFLASAALAQIQIEQPSSFTQCDSTTLTWSGGAGKYVIWMSLLTSSSLLRVHLPRILPRRVFFLVRPLRLCIKAESEVNNLDLLMGLLPLIPSMFLLERRSGSMSGIVPILALMDQHSPTWSPLVSITRYREWAS